MLIQENTQQHQDLCQDNHLIIEWELKSDVQEDATRSDNLCTVPCHGM